MASPQLSAETDDPMQHLPPVKLDPLAGFLSYLIPGLGQVSQGRVGKGLLFFFGLYLLFFYGMWMGQWRNVWLPDVSDMPQLEIAGNQLKGVPSSLWYRPQFMGQFWIGVAAWPAVVQYVNYDRTKNSGPIFGKFERSPTEDELERTSAPVLQALGPRLGLRGHRRRSESAGDLRRLRGSHVSRPAEGIGVREHGQALSPASTAPAGRRRCKQPGGVAVTAALLAVSIYWDLPVLLVVVSLVYAATRHDKWDRILREGFGWGVRIALFLTGIGVVLYLLSTYL